MKIDIEDSPRRPDEFQRTRWSLVAAARGLGNSEARTSFLELCSHYWYPVYAYIRRCGHPADLANDLTEVFFGYLSAQIQTVDPTAHGRFRHFLLSRLSSFLASDWRSEIACTGTRLKSPLTQAELEQHHSQQAFAEATPERAFERSFALAVLSRGMRRLRQEADESGRLQLFEKLEPYLTREPEAGQYAHLEQALGIRAIAIVVSLKRLRSRFREIIDEELRQTVQTAAELERERLALLSIVGDVHV